MSNDKKQQRWIIGSKRFTAMVVTLAAFLVLLGLYVSGSDAVRTELVMLGAVICLFIIIFIALLLKRMTNGWAEKQSMILISCITLPLEILSITE